MPEAPGDDTADDPILPGTDLPAEDPLVGGEDSWGGMPKMEKEESDAAKPEQPAEVRPESARCSGCCGCFLFLLMIAAVIGGYEYYQYRQAHSDELVNQYTELGYTVQRGTIINVSAPLEKNTLLIAKQVNFTTPQKVELAVRAQMCEVSAPLEKKLYFEGKVLTIRKTGVVSELEGEVEAVDLYGELKVNNARATAINRH